MTNFERACAILEKHREARQWTDAAVARDFLETFKIDPDEEKLTDDERASAESHAAELEAHAVTLMEQAQAHREKVKGAADPADAPMTDGDGERPAFVAPEKQDDPA